MEGHKQGVGGYCGVLFKVDGVGETYDELKAEALDGLRECFETKLDGAENLLEEILWDVDDLQARRGSSKAGFNFELNYCWWLTYLMCFCLCKHDNCFVVLSTEFRETNQIHGDQWQQVCKSVDHDLTGINRCVFY